MSRPTSIKVNGTAYWTIALYDEDGALVDADSTPTIAVRKNGSSAADTATVTKRAATTGLYDCSLDVAGEAEGDCYSVEETAVVSSVTYFNSFSFEVEAVERGTNSANTVAPDNASITAILADTNELQGNQGDWATATGFSTFDPASDTVTTDAASRAAAKADVSSLATQASVDSIDSDVQSIGSDVSSILTDTNELQSNQGDWATATGFSTFDHTADAVITDTASRNASKADVSGLSTFDPSSDEVITDNASRVASRATGFSTHDAAAVVSALQAVANDFKANVSGLSTHDAAAVVTALQAVADDFKANVSGLATASSIANLNDFDPDNDVVANVTLVDTTTDLTNQSGGGGGASASDIYDYFVDGTREDAFKADVSGLSTFDPASDEVTTDAASRNASKADVSGINPPSEADIYSHFIAGTRADAFKADVTGLSSHSAEDVYVYFTANTREDVFKADVTGLSTFDASTDQVVASNMRGTDNALLAASAPSNWSLLAINGSGEITTANPASGGGSAHTAADVAALILATPANKLATDASGHVEASNMRGTDGANTVAPVDVSAGVADIKAVTDKLDTALVIDGSVYQFTVNALENAPAGGGGGGGGATAQEIVDAWGNAVAGNYTTAGTFGFYLDAQVSTAGSGGSGLYQASVRVQDTDGNRLQGARVNVDGTTLTLTTDSNGEVQFNLDSGVYLLEVSPPAGYDTPTGQVLTITSTDPAETVFNLETGGCNIPWLG